MEEISNSNGKNYCCGKNRISITNDGELIKKGPWNSEEDQVLINHVEKYGPSNWSSIRSKGLLHRTGKSCRLRWVNKLRPDLKRCKFTAEEERMVIELQSEIGNKWATIATHLKGRTDNDVKNFWSSRQKRLARVFRSNFPQFHKRFKSSTRNPSIFIEEKTSSKPQSSTSSSHTGTTSATIQTTAFPDISNPECPTSEANNEINLRQIPLDEYLISNELHLDTSFLLTFGYSDEPLLSDDGLQPLSCFRAETWDAKTAKGTIDDNLVTPDSFFDDFPADVFDQIESLPSPSRW
ncbi:hypothetical protein RND81_02G107900 [Saponaria officinalis]|uniref:Uncharacterized protein n=1 Tax=Saponaria officinalis TaxID=3572 RepID=A0AAW1MP54_SAPOF